MAWRALLSAAWVLLTTQAGAQYRVREIGSFHMGGKEVILEGLSPHSDEIAMRIDAWLTQNLK